MQVKGALAPLDPPCGEHADASVCSHTLIQGHYGVEEIRPTKLRLKIRVYILYYSIFMIDDRKPELAMLQLPRFDLEDFMVHRMRRPEAVHSILSISERMQRREESPVKPHG
jgi:hypothetical protein